jgi:hypothetical protein
VCVPVADGHTVVTPLATVPVVSQREYVVIEDVDTSLTEKVIVGGVFHVPLPPSGADGEVVYDVTGSVTS